MVTLTWRVYIWLMGKPGVRRVKGVGWQVQLPQPCSVLSVSPTSLHTDSRQSCSCQWNNSQEAESIALFCAPALQQGHSWNCRLESLPYLISSHLLWRLISWDSNNSKVINLNHISKPLWFVETFQGLEHEPLWGFIFPLPIKNVPHSASTMLE